MERDGTWVPTTLDAAAARQSDREPAAV